MDPFIRSRIGSTEVEVTRMGFGGAPLGDPDEVISEDQAEATLAAAWDAGLRFFDTAPWYGNTKSEHRFGHFLRRKKSFTHPRPKIFLIFCAYPPPLDGQLVGWENEVRTCTIIHAPPLSWRLDAQTHLTGHCFIYSPNENPVPRL